jgi:hypothetical protein
MDYRYKQLEQELSALSKVFGELGERLREVAGEVTAPGVPPSEKLLEQISIARASFDHVRGAVHGHAAAMLVSPLPKIAEVVSTAALDTLLKASAAAEENRFSIEDERELALGILSRVLAIAHRETADFKPLQECHAKVGELRNAITKVAWPHRHPDAESITGLKHPSTALLMFVENLDTLEDDRWMALETTITESYGKPLFVAASRGKLVPQAAPPVVEKPIEKKMAVEKAPEKPAPAASPANLEKKAAAPPTPAPVEKKEAVQPPPKPGAPANQVSPVAAVSAPPAPVHVPANAVPAPAMASTPVTPGAAAPATPAMVVTSTSAAPAPPVAAAPVPPAPARSATPAPQSAIQINSLQALATATEPAVERKPAAASTSDIADRQRKEPRLASPAPQPAARLEAKPQEQEMLGDEAQQGTVNGDGGQRTQRWGFWRGNR